MAASATLYVCGPCKARGVRVNAITRPRIDGAKVALCQDCADARSGKVAVSPDWTRAATAFAWQLLGDARDASSYWARAGHAARRVGIWASSAEDLADAIRDRFVANVVADLPAGGDISTDALTFKGRPVTVRDIFNASTRAHTNMRRDIAAGEALGQTIQPIAAELAGIAWDPEVLAVLDIEDQLQLMIFADDDTPDGREPTRDDATAFIQGRTVPVKRDITDALMGAATRYLAAKRNLG